MTDDIPISLVAHTVFCERRAWLEAAGEQVRSFAIESGTRAHRKVDQKQSSRVERKLTVDVGCRELGVIGRCDVVTVTGDTVEVREFKSAPLRKTYTPTQAQRVQLALQGICLEEAGYEVSGYSIYFTTSKRSVPVEVTSELRSEARRYVERTRDIVLSGDAPEPLVDDPRCGQCSHFAVCMPDEHRSEAPVRRVHAGDPDGQVVQLTTQGSRASKSAGRLKVTQDGELVGDLPMAKVAGLIVHGNADVSSALVRELLWQDRTIVWCSSRGRVVGFARGGSPPNGQARVIQCALSHAGDVELAGAFVTAKIANQITILRRNGGDGISKDLAQMRLARKELDAACTVQELYGLEGKAAAVYFESFSSMFRSRMDDRLAELWPGVRERSRPDPVNAALNYLYGVLASDLTRAILAAGLDPSAGFLHSPGRNKPALALDLMEEFRPLIADSVLLTGLNTGALTLKCFVETMGSWRLSDRGRRVLIDLYEQRVRKSFTHPVFGYEVEWRRAFEVQARMLLGVFDGTQETYTGVTTR